MKLQVLLAKISLEIRMVLENGVWQYYSSLIYQGT